MAAHDVLIVGGGPAGASAAILLARAGWSVVVVEKDAFPRRKVCGEFVGAPGILQLAQLGVAPAFRARAGPEVRRVGLFAGKVVASAPMPPGAPGPEGYGRALGREHLDALLLEQAAHHGARIYQPCSVVELRRARQGFRCIVRSPRQADLREIEAGIVINAYGGLQAAGRSAQRCLPSDLVAFKAHFRNARLPLGLMPLIAFPGGYGGLVETDAGRITLSCCIRRDVLARVRGRFSGLAAGESVGRYIEGFSRGVHEALAGAVRDGAWLAAAPIRPGIRGVFRDGQFFVGNAAGEAHPAIAEGIGMAMQSAALLVSILEHSPRALGSRALAREVAKEYQARWRSHFASRIRFSALAAGLAMRPYAGWSQLVAFAPAILSLGASLSGKDHALA